MNFTKDFFENYNVKDLLMHTELLNIYGNTSNSSISRFNDDVIEESVNELTDEEKMEIVDIIYPDFSHKLKPLVYAFREDDNNGVIKRTRYSYNYHSLRSWCKSHNIYCEYSDTEMMLFLKSNSVYDRFHYCLKLTSNDEKIKRFIKNFICFKLSRFLRDEIKYFRENDEYTKEAEKLRTRNVYPEFNDYYYRLSSKNDKLYKVNKDSEKATIMSLEEIKETNRFLDSLDNEVNMLIFSKFDKFQGVYI